MSDKFLIFRFGERYKEIFYKLANETGKSYKQFFEDIFKDYIEKNKKKLNGEDKKYLLEYERKGLYNEEKRKLKERNFHNYIIKNAYKVIFEQSVYFMLNNGKINMNVIVKTINSYIKLWEKYSKEYKDDLLDDINALECLKDEDTLIEKMKIFKLANKRIKQIKC